MYNKIKQISFVSLIIVIAVFMIIGFWESTTTNVFAQDEDYYQELEDQEDQNEVSEEQRYIDSDEFSDEAPDDQGVLESENFQDDETQNPDPEFIEQQEPGEYDQSDDTTELNEDYY